MTRPARRYLHDQQWTNGRVRSTTMNRLQLWAFSPVRQPSLGVFVHRSTDPEIRRVRERSSSRGLFTFSMGSGSDMLALSTDTGTDSWRLPPRWKISIKRSRTPVLIFHGQLFRTLIESRRPPIFSLGRARRRFSCSLAETGNRTNSVWLSR